MAAGRQIAAGRRCPRSRCVIVGQHQLLVECLCLLLQSELEICSVALSEASVARIMESSPDCVVIECSLPSDGIPSLIWELRQERPGLAIAVLSRGCTGGSLQIVQHFCSAIELLQWMRKRLETVPTRQESTATQKNSEEAGLNLSHRELEVLVLLMRGLRMKEVARKLGISPRTVAFHKYRAMESNGLRTQADLLKFALDHGLLSGNSLRPRIHIHSARCGSKDPPPTQGPAIALKMGDGPSSSV